MSRVKAGDLAIIRCAEALYNNRIVEVLYPAPCGQFRMPDGLLGNTHGHPEPTWVVKFIGGKSLVPTNQTGDFFSHYSICPDWALYPLPGDPESLDERKPDEVSA